MTFEQRYVQARRRFIEADFANLNDMQRKAVLATEGPLLLLAGAGSGKTTVLIHRIANLIQYGRGSDTDEVPDTATEADLALLERTDLTPDERRRAQRAAALEPVEPWRIIAITFTNKAADELKDRIERMLGPEAAADIWASTFHSACVRILRRDADKLGYPNSFTIYDTSDSQAVVKRILKEMNLDEKAFPYRAVLTQISRAKDSGITPEQDLARAQAVLQAELDRITLPTEPVTSLTLPRYPVKEGIDPSQVDYSKYDNFNTWATVTWTSANDQIVKVGSAPYTPYYAPYATTLTRTAADQQVTLTASIVCNSIEGLTLTKAFTVTVAASQESQATLREQLQAKLDAGFAAYGGLRDAVTGEPLEERDGKYIAANDIHFPTTRDFGVDGKYTPVIITSSDADTIVPPGVNNAARVEVYRPLPGEDAKDVTVTVTIKDKETGIAVSRDFVIAVQPLTQQEIDAELALMAEVKAHYFDGIRNGNPDPEHITGNLHAFREAYLNADGQLVWVYDVDDQANHGIVPSELPGWQASERWRLFRSTNPAVISHENLLVTRATEHKAVTIVSELSSETLGKYAARYPDNADFQALSHQAVSARLIVRGTAPTSDEPQVTTSTVTFQLHTDTEMWIQPTVVYDQPEGTTAMDVFRQVLTANGYSYEAKGSYVQAVIKPDGTKVAEFSKGPNSGWVFRVNGEFPDVAMQDYQLSDGDVIEVLFIANYMDEPGLFLPFTDVNNHWAYSAIKRVYNRGLMLGVSDTRFAPNQALSRAMLVTVLYRLADEPDVTADNPFTDVPAGQWYTNAVIWAAANGIVSGFGDGTFRPNEPATRAQAAVMLCGYAKLAGRDTTQHADLSAYADAAEIPSWALAEMQWANAAQLIRGRSDTILAPNAGTTRAEMAKILSTFIGK